jgi:hypothetical protein
VASREGKFRLWRENSGIYLTGALKDNIILVIQLSRAGQRISILKKTI